MQLIFKNNQICFIINILEGIMDIEFNSLQELKKRVTPALNTKLKELKHNNYNHVTAEDIWNYLTKNKWKKSSDLTLYDIINDILNLNNEDIEEYAIRSDKDDKSKRES